MNSSLLRVMVCIALAQASLSVCAEKRVNDSTNTVAQQEIARAGTQRSMPGSADYFVGQVRVEPVWPADANINASGGMVTFEAGARSAWHIHPAGQRLVVMSGRGLTQEWGKPVQQIFPSDVVWCPPGVKHWHGAMSDSTMTHLAVTGTVNGKNVSWMEKVTDEQYNAR